MGWKWVRLSGAGSPLRHEVLIFEGKTDIGFSEKCLKVGELTKICVKFTKSGGIALVEVGEMCKKLEKFGAEKEAGVRGTE